MRRITVLTLMSLACLTAAAASADDVALKTDDDKTIYALGMLLTRDLAPFNLTAQELELLVAGMRDQAQKNPAKADPQVYGAKIQELRKSRAAAFAAADERAAIEFLANAAADKSNKKTASGLLIATLQSGSGSTPKATDKVKVNYRGTLIDGTEFDSSFKRGTPASFAVNRVIPCWTEALQLMQVGGKSRLICPGNIAYGEQGLPPLIKRNATLVFEVELLGIEK